MKYIVDEARLVDIADAIRGKTGKTDGLTLEQMPTEIEGISVGEAIPDGTEVTFGKTYASESVKAYYNGVLLPKIPADVLASYPYAWITTYNSNYFLRVATTRVYLDESRATAYLKQAASISHSCRASTDYVEWEHSDAASDALISPTDLVWSNHDIPKGSTTATEIYYKGTEPEDAPGEGGLIDAEREEKYSIASEDLNDLAYAVQKKTGDYSLLTISQMVEYLEQLAQE